MTRNNSGEESGARGVHTSRRRFLAATGAAGVVGATGIALGQQGPTIFELGGEVAGWQGQAPDAIAGETNPTLSLEAGQEYEVIWENLDGQPHDFVIDTEGGEELVATEIFSEQGATHSVTFTATQEMNRYVCTVHPTTMAGNVVVSDEGGGATPEETPTPEGAQFVPEGPAVGAELVADGPLVNPVNLRTVPGATDTHLIVDQAGYVYVLSGGELREEPFLDVSDAIAFLDDREGGFDERGLLGLDLHPDFETNGQFYVRYSALEPVSEGETLVGPGGRTFPEDWDHVEVLSEFQIEGEVGDADLAADPDSERVLLEVPEPQFNHNGGEVTFGADGYLYASLGDGGGANDNQVGHVEDWYDGNEGGNGQDVTDNLLGSILRLDVDGEGEDTPYAIPEDNPLVGTDGMDEIYAWGLRNPWRMSFNEVEGVNEELLITADVGQALFEEVDVVESGGNYGWNVREGFHCFDAADATSIPAECPTSTPEEPPDDGQPLFDPVLEYPHTYQGTPVGISITGGYVGTGEGVAELGDRYVFGDWSTNFAAPAGRVFVTTDPPAAEAPEATADGDAAGAGTPTAEDAADGGAGNVTGAENGTVGGNVTNGGNVTGAGNVTSGENVTDGGNATAGGNATGGENATAGEGEATTETPMPVEGQTDVMTPDEQPWPYEEVTFEGGEGGRLNRFIQAFGRDAEGNLYVLASRTGRLTSEAGEVFRLVPAGEGEEIGVPEAMPAAQGAGDDAAGNETMGNQTMGNETMGNETVGNETMGNETMDNETMGNETVGNETGANETA